MVSRELEAEEKRWWKEVSEDKKTQYIRIATA
jgi:hypothetical protein